MTYFSTRAGLSRVGSIHAKVVPGTTVIGRLILVYVSGTGSYKVQVAKTSKDYSREITESIRHEVRSLECSIVFFTEGVLAPEPVEVIFATDAACSSIVLVFYLERTLKA